MATTSSAYEWLLEASRREMIAVAVPATLDGTPIVQVMAGTPTDGEKARRYAEHPHREVRVSYMLGAMRTARRAATEAGASLLA